MLQFSSRVPCLSQIHQTMIEKLVMCMEYLFAINKRCVLPLSNNQCCTPLCSPMGNIVSYHYGLVQCLLESVNTLSWIQTKETECELLLLTNLFVHVVQATSTDMEF